jgi:PAS domain S-box-containing protein
MTKDRPHANVAGGFSFTSQLEQVDRRSDSLQPWLTVRIVWLAVFLAAAYYAGAQLGLALTFKPHPIAALWPPNAILLAALLLARPRSWPLLLAAALAAHLAAELQGGVPLIMVLCWFVSNAFEALLGAIFIRRLIPGPFRFTRLRDLVLFLAFGVFMASFVSSFLDAAFVKMAGWGSAEYWDLWLARFLSNVLAALTLTPFIVSWSTERIAQVLRLSAQRWIEAGALSIGLAVSLSLFSGQEMRLATAPALLYAPLPFLLWAAVRFGVRGASTVLVLITFVATLEAVHGYGPFVAASPTDSALGIQVFLIVVSIPLLALAAVVQEQQETKEALRENEERLNLALNAAQMGAWDWSIGGGAVTWSPESQSMFGVDRPNHAVSLDVFFELVHAEDRDAVKDALARAVRHDTPYEIEFRIVRPDGKLRWIMGKGKTLRSPAGRAVRMLGINMDITERKSADIEAEQQRQQVSHLTRVAVLGELSGALAHELNQPLTAILSNSQAAQRLLQNVPLDLEEMQEILQDITNEDKRAGEVIKRLRTLLKKGEAQRQLLDLNDIVQEVVALSHADLVARNIELSTRMGSGFPRVLGDAVQLQQVLLNLVRNACDAMDAIAFPQRKLTIISAVHAPDLLQVSVADRGVGITGTDLEKLFEPFFSTKPQGMGLGLSISRSVIAAHGGRLWAQNNADGGATFAFTLPVRTEASGRVS